MSPAATIAEGPLGLEGLHSWNGVTLGRENTFPRYYIDRITGLRDRPEAEDNRAPHTGRHGEVVYPSLQRGKTVVYEGRVQAPDPISLAEAVSDLLAATADTFEYNLTISPFTGRGGVAWLAPGRVQTCICDVEQTRGPNARPTPWQREFVLSIRTRYPVFFESATDTGSHASHFTATNTGNGPSPSLILTIALTGAGDVEVWNDTMDASLVFEDFPTGGDLIINFGARTAIMDPVGAAYDAIPFLNDITSDWWDEEFGGTGLVAGPNALRQAGGGLLTALWYNASY